VKINNIKDLGVHLQFIVTLISNFLWKRFQILKNTDVLIVRLRFFKKDTYTLYSFILQRIDTILFEHVVIY
jgi:hypothetical protein